MIKREQASPWKPVRKRLLDSISNLEIATNDAQQQANEYGGPRDRYDAFRGSIDEEAT
ncbi:MAG: hypothetical protein IPH88_07590 [Bacteroidales bacterium]|nr:hypothetical protein [Bacteroidales bacterium]